MRELRRARGLLALALARPDAVVFGDLEGNRLSPERVSRNFGQAVAACRKEHPDLPAISLHGLRHTHATLLLRAGVPVHTVSKRLGHASATITLQVYSHVLGGDDEAAASMFASMTGPEASREASRQLPGSDEQAGEGR